MRSQALALSLIVLLLPLSSLGMELLDRKISISIKGLSYAQALDALSESGSFDLSYNTAILPAGLAPRIEADSEALSKVLNQLFSESYVSYRSFGNMLILYQDKAVRYRAKNEVHGLIKDERSGAALSEVKVYDKYLNLASETNSLGQFTLTVPNPDYTLYLVCEKEGFTSKEVRLDVKSDQQLSIKLGKAAIPKKRAHKQPVLNSVEAERITKPVQKSALVSAIISEPPKEEENPFLDFSSLQLGLIPGITTEQVLPGQGINKLSISALIGYHAGLQGVEIAGMLSINRFNVEGFQIAGFGNFLGGRLDGMQIAGFANISKLKAEGMQIAGFNNFAGAQLEGLQVSGFNNLVWGELKGMQVAGFSNFSTKDGWGLQAAGFANVSRGSLDGFQISGFGNYAKHCSYAQLSGFTNIAGRVGKGQVAGFYNQSAQCGWGQASGFHNRSDSVGLGQVTGFYNQAGYCGLGQIAGFYNQADSCGLGQISGFLNRADRVRGAQITGGLNIARHAGKLQIGLVNLSDTIDGVAIGLLSVVRRGYRHLELAYHSHGLAEIRFKTGTAQFHNILALGNKREGDNGFWLAGYGLGTQLRPGKRLGLCLHGTGYYVRRFRNARHGLSLYTRLDALLSWKLKGRLSLIGGPSWNAYFHGQDVAEPYQGFYSGSSISIGKQRVAQWAGFQFGLQF